jgi:ech hydrogenase subunit B
MTLVLILTAPIWAGLIYGIERKIKARMQSRQGPPILQPFYDLAKLTDKRVLIVSPLHAMLGVAHFASAWLALSILLSGGDILVAIFFHLFSTALLVMAGFSVNSPFSRIGSLRQLMMIIASEPIFILAAFGMYLNSGRFDNLWGAPSSLSQTWLLLIALLIVLPITLKKSPFDTAEAHQEIVGGAEIEYSGIFYEAVYGAKWLDMIFCYAFVALFAGANLALGVALAVGTFLLINIVDNSTARVKVMDTIKIAFAIALPLAMANLLLIGVFK